MLDPGRKHGSRGPALVLVAAPVLVAGCGAGTAAVVAGSGDSGGGGTTPALDLFALDNPRSSPALLRLDASHPVRVGLFYGEQPMMQLELITGNQLDLPANEIELQWDFARERGGSTEFREGVRVMAKVAGSVISGGELPVSVGNDAPEVTAATAIVDPLEGEAVGIARVQVTVEDSSDDVVDVLPEFDIQGDEPDAGWQPATGFGLTGVRAPREGTTLDFFWETNTDLRDIERIVTLRFKATDGLLTGAPFSAPTFGVDNNDVPIVQIDEAFLLTEDQVRGIPLSYRVLDSEGDPVRVVLQWRREDEADFPDLGTSDVAALTELLRDPDYRREKQVCSPYARFARGRIEPIDATRARLPELLAEGAWLLPGGVEGLELELLHALLETRLDRSQP